MLFFYSDNDDLANPTDFARLRTNFPAQTVVEKVEGWGHLDFVWSENVKELAYNTVLNFVNNVNYDDDESIVKKYLGK